ncbi:hypothetical protein GA0070558_121142 [Micromonospora haikouensis]|uniref:Uncharacterized protein n=1 Tax=Micromonospora haikouensis TaxID=686309 RepID=A0A1C4X4G0_9ACTN|nr:hypothetical protein [Micromonospora haikouensis]SCF03363.1 hypothetical protein GA0070558_121142 [Micromonospora haikouensis]
MGTTAATGGRWGRLALLLCTLIGLAAMHTLGHGAHSGGTHAGHDGAAPRDGHPAPAAFADGAAVPATLAGGTGGPVALAGGTGGLVAPAVPVALAGGADALWAFAGGMAVRVGGMVAAALGARAGCPAGGCAPARLLPDGGGADGPSGWSACLAVLGALGVALLVAVLLLTRARAPGPPGWQAGGVSAGPRAPPSRPLGLRLAEVSVSRT